MRYLIGIDAGTTNQKAILFDENGTPAAQAIRPTATIRFPNGGAVYDPQQLWENICALLHTLKESAGAKAISRVEGLAITGMGEAGVPLDGQGQPLYPIIAWFDPRTLPYVDRWKNSFGETRLSAISGLRAQHIFSANKLMWLRDYEPEVFRKLWKWACVEDYLAYRMCGELKMDTTIGSRTMLMDLAAEDWSAPLLDTVGLRREQLPELVPSGTLVGRITADAAHATGLCAGTPVFTGGHDHICGALACGILGTDRILDSSGTAEEILLSTQNLLQVLALGAKGFNVGCYAKVGYYYMAGGIPASGASMDWFRQKFGPQEDCIPGANGLLFLPHLRGSSSPQRDLTSRGAYIGIRSEHTPADFAQAVCEGLCYEFRLCAQQLLQGNTAQRIITIGGGAKNDHWLQTKADITGLPIEVPETREATALGAALLAGIGAGVYQNAEDAVRRTYRVGKTVQPRAEFRALYDHTFPIYQELYQTLRPVYQKLKEASL